MFQQCLVDELILLCMNTFCFARVEEISTHHCARYDCHEEKCFNSSGCLTLARNSLFKSKLIKKEGESPNLSIRRAITADTSPKNFHGVPLYARMMVIGRKIKWVFI